MVVSAIPNSDIWEMRLESTNLNKGDRYGTRADVQCTTVNNNGKAADTALLIFPIATIQKLIH